MPVPPSADVERISRSKSGGSVDSSGDLSQFRISHLSPHSWHTTYSCSNRSYGPQSRPCVSTELAIRNSPIDEPQSGQAIVLDPFHFGHLELRWHRSRASKGLIS